MKNNIRIIKTNYNVDKVNKVVVCQLDCDMQFIKHPAFDSFCYEDWQIRMREVRSNGRFTVKAKARCNPDDTFDEVIGKRIAESRAKAKMYSVGRRVWREIYENLDLKLTQCLGAQIACKKAYEKEINHIRELIQKTF